MSNPLTLAREACWDAIDNFPALNPLGSSVFRKKLRFDSDDLTPADLLPAVTELPCICVVPFGMPTEWDTNRMMEWGLTLNLQIFTGLNLATSEQLVFDTLKAIYKAAPDGSSVSYVKNGTTGTGHHAKKIGQIRWSREQVGTGSGITALLAQIQIALRLNVDPFA